MRLPGIPHQDVVVVADGVIQNPGGCVVTLERGQRLVANPVYKTVPPRAIDKAIQVVIRGARRLYRDRDVVKLDALYELPVKINANYRAFVGHCISKRDGVLVGVLRPVLIEIGGRLNIPADYLPTLLVHEFCHAATILINGSVGAPGGHGDDWMTLMVACGLEPSEFCWDDALLKQIGRELSSGTNVEREIKASRAREEDRRRARYEFPIGYVPTLKEWFDRRPWSRAQYELPVPAPKAKKPAAKPVVPRTPKARKPAPEKKRPTGGGYAVPVWARKPGVEYDERGYRKNGPGGAYRAEGRTDIYADDDFNAVARWAQQEADQSRQNVMVLLGDELYAMVTPSR